jgi:DNA (cytosine-5)-methyltransferase 1
VDSTQNIISFCTGYGGLERGIRRAGVDTRTVCYCEREAYVQAVLVKEIEEGRLDSAPIWSDLATFPSAEFHGKVHGITCGYPCQPFSSVGKRKGEDDPRHLWPRIREHARSIGVEWIFAENVEGHISLGLSTVISDLEEDGFKCAWGIFSAEEVGAPHQRKRVYILAHTASREPRQSQAWNGGQDTSGGSEEELGDTAKHGRGSRSPNTEAERVEREGEEGRLSEFEGGCIQLWPARPGEEQYEWEEPRVTEAQSELGGAVDGLTHRVDRLRLLGNGVVPQTAELAWKTLWRKMNEDND